MKTPEDRSTNRSRDGRGKLRICSLQHRPFQTHYSISEIVQEATMQGEATQQRDSIPAPREDRASITKYGGNHHEITIIFNNLSPPCFFRAVRSFGECGAMRDENRPHRHSGSPEFFAKMPANTGDFRHSDFGPRDFPEGRMAEGEVLAANTLLVE